MSEPNRFLAGRTQGTSLGSIVFGSSLGAMRVSEWLPQAYGTSGDVVNIALDRDVIGPLAAQIEQLRIEVAELKRLASTRTSVIAIHTLDSDVLQLRLPLSVVLSEEDGVLVASAPEVDLYGDGETEQEALASLRCRICDEIVDLEEHIDELGPIPARQLARLRELVVRG